VKGGCFKKKIALNAGPLQMNSVESWHELVLPSPSTGSGSTVQDRSKHMVPYKKRSYRKQSEATTWYKLTEQLISATVEASDQCPGPEQTTTCGVYLYLRRKFELSNLHCSEDDWAETSAWTFGPNEGAEKEIFTLTSSDRKPRLLQGIWAAQGCKTPSVGPRRVVRCPSRRQKGIQTLPHHKKHQLPRH